MRVCLDCGVEVTCACAHARAERAEAERDAAMVRVERLALRVGELEHYEAELARQVAARVAVDAAENAEIARLRAALETARHYWEANDDGHVCGGKSGGWCDGCLLREALRALAAKGEG